jgi:hypothetical protein
MSNPNKRRPLVGLMTRDEAWKLLQPYAERLHGWLQDAWDWVQSQLNQDPERRATFDCSTIAAMVYDRFKFLVKGGLDSDKRLSFVEHGRMLNVALDGALIIRMKKLDRTLSSRNIHTRNQESMYCQQLRFEGIGDRATNVTFGYTTDITSTALRRVCFTCPIGWTRNQWHIQLSGTDESGAFLFDPHGFNNGLPGPNVGRERKADEA